jgi:hypothetical protein
MKAISAPFTVTFGKVARTVEYQDAAGTILFTFDVGEGERSLVLEHHGIRRPRMPNYGEAFARSKQFLESRGYEVGEFGVAVPPAPLPEEEVSALIHGAIHGLPPSSVRLVVPPRRASFRDDVDGSRWDLWLVALPESGPHRGHKLVFDEQTKQFGVASDTGVFLGFWGSFSQSVEALLAP